METMIALMDGVADVMEFADLDIQSTGEIDCVACLS